MMLGFDGSSANAPTDPVGWPSKIGVQVRPKSSVFQTPPLVAATKKTLGWSAIPAMATVRPARNGPMHRQERSLYGTAEPDCATAATPLRMRTTAESDGRIDIDVLPLFKKLPRINL